jgi:hypothetical protein
MSGNGKRALGICDRSGFEYPLKDLVEEYEDGVPNGLRVHRDMLDPDHPQLKLGDVHASDRQSLDNARPDDAELAASRAIYSWNPVGVGNLLAIGQVGQVKVVIG